MDERLNKRGPLLTSRADNRTVMGSRRNRLTTDMRPSIRPAEAKRIQALLVTAAISLLLLSSSYLVDGYQIAPGTGLRSKDSRVQIVIFEHTEHGTGGLVLNCPTPLCMGELPIPRFQPFKDLPLMLGSGLGEDEEEECNIALGEVSPWFWLRDVDGIPGSFALPGARGALYMGGNIEEATKKLEQEQIDPKGRFKFFRKYKAWSAGELEKELKQGLWKAMEQDPKEALESIQTWA